MNSCSTPDPLKSPLNSNFRNLFDDRNETIESLRKENIQLIEKMTILKKQWNDVVDHSVDVDKRLMESKTLIDQLKVSIEVLEAENTILRSENKNFEIELQDLRDFYSPGGTVSNYEVTRNPVTVTKNSFSVLNDCNAEHNVLDKNKQARITKKNLITPIGVKPNATKPKKLKKNKRLLIIADSHGRDLGWDLNSDLCDHGFEVTVVAKSGAKFNTVTHDVADFTKDFDFNDRVVVLAGANDIVNNTEQPTELDLLPLVETSKRTKAVKSELLTILWTLHEFLSL
ncbi:hypothetical protein LSTR_LSTR004475 [Laodelphax striatellus]|uniref:Uncharacterized protein n=1 Tax=Laodelphax striatellus TaxID=195883 RepID=A0A482XLU0_LAOST|nr:hypothetical protein LSTR_LSTR004475 [Laodelphax striatellus]